MQNKKHSNKWIWVWVCILFVCVAATTLVVLGRMNVFLLDDSGAMPLVADVSVVVTPTSKPTEAPTPTSVPNVSTSSTPAPENTAQPEDEFLGSVGDKYNPSFETEWTNSSEVEIFRISYANGEGKITVNSNGTDKVIAPGTSNNYTFKLKNTGNVSKSYKMVVEMWFEPAGIVIPVEVRINRYDRTWILGERDTFVSASEVDTVEDNGILSAGNYTYYTLEWQWPFESGNDELDTLLGNMATEEDITFSIAINVVAEATEDPEEEGGIHPGQTGDDWNNTLWITLAVCSFIVLILPLFRRKKDEESEYTDAV